MAAQDINILTIASVAISSAPPGTSVDGGHATLGTTTDLATANTVIGRLKALLAAITGGSKTGANSVSVVLASDQTAIPVSFVGNVSITAITSGSRTTTQTSADIPNLSGRYIHVILDMTTVGTGSVTLNINGKDATSGKYYPLLVGAAITTNSTNVYRVGPAFAPSANATANDMIPATLQFVVNANNANAATYSVGYNIGGN